MAGAQGQGAQVEGDRGKWQSELVGIGCQRLRDGGVDLAHPFGVPLVAFGKDGLGWPVIALQRDQQAGQFFDPPAQLGQDVQGEIIQVVGRQVREQVLQGPGVQQVVNDRRDKIGLGLEMTKEGPLGDACRFGDLPGRETGGVSEQDGAGGGDDFAASLVGR